MGNLPGTRPLAANYGEELEDDKPIDDPKRELGAGVVNPMRHDLAYCARMTSLLKIRVTNSGTAAITSVEGPEGVLASQVTVTRHGIGDLTVDWTATGVSAVDVHGSTRHATIAGTCATRAPTTTSVRLKTMDMSILGAMDCDFTLWVC